MPLNAFRSLLDAHPFKGRSTENAIGILRLNYALLAGAYLNAPAPAAIPIIGYDRERQLADLRALDRLLFVYYADRLRALIEDAVRVFIENDPRRAPLLAPKHSAWKKPSATVEDIRPGVEDAGDRATRGTYAEIASRMSNKFGVTMFSPAELKYLTYVAEARNLIVHRGELVDRRFVEKSGAALAIGSEVNLPSIAGLSARAISLPMRVGLRLAGLRPSGNEWRPSKNAARG